MPFIIDTNSEGWHEYSTRITRHYFKTESDGPHTIKSNTLRYNYDLNEHP